MPPRNRVRRFSAGVDSRFDDTAADTDQIIHQALVGHVFSATDPTPSNSADGHDASYSRIYDNPRG